MLSSDKKLTLADYKVGAKIGGGSLGDVFRVTRNNEDRALKQIRLTPLIDDEQDLAAVRQEVRRLKNLRKHANIVSFFASFEDNGFSLNMDGSKVDDRSTWCLYFELEFCGGSSLHRQISTTRNEQKFFSEKLIAKWLGQLVSALKFIHDDGIVHRDIKPKNLLLMDDMTTIKLADLGFANLKNIFNNPRYTAPELFDPMSISPNSNNNISDNNSNPKTDVWSLGVVLFELITLDLPYQGASHREIKSNIVNNNRAAMPDHYYSDDLKKIASWLLAVNPSERPLMAEVIEDPYIKSILPTAASVPKRRQEHTLEQQ